MLSDSAGLNHVTSQIIAAAVRVHRELGPGLLESAYGACLTNEIQSTGLHFESQVALPLFYHGVRLEVGYRIDLLVEHQVVVEVKAVETLAAIHRAQVLTYPQTQALPGRTASELQRAAAQERDRPGAQQPLTPCVLRDLRGSA